ncbi:MAG: hypothetical protein IIY45_10970 [Firmicutes bacterium]|nr:hypothetical protein [Bacillota bacterium]
MAGNTNMIGNKQGKRNSLYLLLGLVGVALILIVGTFLTVRSASQDTQKSCPFRESSVPG